MAKWPRIRISGSRTFPCLVGYPFGDGSQGRNVADPRKCPLAANSPQTAFGEVWPDSERKSASGRELNSRIAHSGHPSLTQIPTNWRLISDALQTCDDRIARHTFVLGDLAEN